MIIVDTGCSSTIVMVILVEKPYTEKDTVMKWHTQAVNITTNLKVKIYFILTALSTINGVMWKCHVHDSAKGR